MNREVRAHLDFIKYLKVATKRQSRFLIDTITSDQLKALRDIIYNILLGNCRVKTSTKTKLMKYKSIMRAIVERSVSRNKLKDLFKKLIPILSLILSEALHCL